RTWVVRAESAGAATSCEEVAPLISWSDAWRLADRLEPELFEDYEARNLVALLVPGETAETLGRRHIRLEIQGEVQTSHGLLVFIGPPAADDLTALLLDPAILSLSREEPGAEPSGE